MAQFPLPGWRYVVLLRDSASMARATAGSALAAAGGGFTDCSGLEVSTEIFEYMEGGQNAFTHKLPSRTKPADIVLKRGLLVATDLWEWIRQVTDGTYQRRDGMIVLLAQTGVPAQAWLFHRGLPLKWTGPTLSSTQNGVATESLAIAHEGLEYVPLGTTG
jgi:phage tail-like protein